MVFKGFIDCVIKDVSRERTSPMIGGLGSIVLFVPALRMLLHGFVMVATFEWTVETTTTPEVMRRILVSSVWDALEPYQVV